MARRSRAFPLSLVLALSVASAARAGEPPKPAPETEPEVLIPKGARQGGWGGPAVEIGEVRDRTAVYVGGRGGWLVDGRFTLGIGGFGLASDIPAPTPAPQPGQELDLSMGYGGAWLEYTFRPAKLLHLSVGTLVGGGGLSLVFHHGGDLDGDDDGFFVAEPAVAAELNLTSFMRVDLGVAYRFVAGVDLPGLSDSDVGGVSGVAVLKFGKF
jgi:hypothetical protein